MPEVKPKWVGKSYLLCDKQTRVGQSRIPVLTLDQVEEWLRREYAMTNIIGSAVRATYKQSAISDLLAQVQAWRKGGK